MSPCLPVICFYRCARSIVSMARIHSPGDGNLDGFQFGATPNKVGVNLYVQASFCGPVFTFVLCKYLGMALLDQRAGARLTSLETARLSPEGILYFRLPHVPAAVRRRQPTASELWWCLPVASIHIFLTTDDVEHFSVCFLTFCLSSFVNYSSFLSNVFDFDFLFLS